jgi:hypothetical protein
MSLTLPKRPESNQCFFYQVLDPEEFEVASLRRWAFERCAEDCGDLIRKETFERRHERFCSRYLFALSEKI